jgi:hypothetical protein
MTSLAAPLFRDSIISFAASLLATEAIVEKTSLKKLMLLNLRVIKLNPQIYLRSHLLF